MGRNNEDTKREYDRRYYLGHKKEKLERKRRWCQEHKEEQREYYRQYTQRLKAEVLSHYSNGSPMCVRCRIDDIDILTIDHINDGGNKHRKAISYDRGGLAFYKWLRREGFPEGYQVLCYNCNMKKARSRGQPVPQYRVNDPTSQTPSKPN